MRRYGTSSMHPKGFPEAPDRCIVEVWQKDGWGSHQCTRSRGKGPDGTLCGIHARQLAQGRKLFIPDE